MGSDSGDAGNRWLDERRNTDGEAYDAPYATRAAAGENIHGEADLVESFGPRTVLDAGCGTGRVAIELARRGVAVVGVDIDPQMLATARRKAPDLEWHQADLATVDLGRQFDLILMAGNVMIFLAPGTEGAVLHNMARHLAPGGVLVAGFQLSLGYLQLDDYDRLAAAAGLVLEARYATWDRAPWHGLRTYAVSVHRHAPRPGAQPG
jgi:SAM-dependent methyltransferase